MSNIEVFNVKEAGAIGFCCSEQFPDLQLVFTRSKSKRIIGADAYYCVDAGSAWVSVTVPAGFETDLDSVPRQVPLAHAWFKGRTTAAAVFHDYLYANKVDRELADKAFLRAMELEGVRKRYRLPIYWAVRFFGAAYYDEKRRG